MAKKLVQGISDGLRNQEQDRGPGNRFLYNQGYNIGQALREEVEGQLQAATIQYTKQINKIIRETKTRFQEMSQLENDLRVELKQVHEAMRKSVKAMRKSVKKGEEVTVVIKESAGQTHLRV